MIRDRLGLTDLSEPHGSGDRPRRSASPSACSPPSAAARGWTGRWSCSASSAFRRRAFVTGIFLLYVFGVVLGWFPTFGPGRGFLDRVWHLVLPAIALALSVMAIVIKITRARR